MRDRKGWKALGYESFKAYGEKELGYQEAHIYRLVEAAEVSLQIGYSPLGESSPKETHLRPLKAVPEEERKAIWEEATRKAEEENAKLTAKRAMVGAKLKSLFEEQAKQRQIEAAKVGGSKTEDDYQRSESVTNVEKKVVPNLAPSPDAGKSRDKAASVVNVSHGSIDNATKVIKNGAPELVKAVEQGKIAIRPQYRVLARK